MCLIIETKTEITIPKFVMKDMYERNSDGYGFMYIRDGEVIGEKYQDKTLDELYEKYLELKEFSPYIHLRMKTHGDINPEQSHPFYCGHGIWMMHNGILGGVQGADKTKSDTWYFANDYLLPLFDEARDPHSLLANEAFQVMISKFIGGNNRIVIMDKHGGLRFNDDIWHIIRNEETQCVGMRVSNTYAWDLHTKKVTHYPTTKTHYSGGTTNHQRLPHYGTHQPSQHGTGTVIVPPGMPKSESRSGDPPGSFRDQQGDLWVYTGRGWMKASRYKELYPDQDTPFTTITEAQEVLQPHPTCPKIAESDSSKNGTVQENGKSSESCVSVLRRRRSHPMSFIDETQTDEEQAYGLDLYEDYLYDQWGELTYQQVKERVLEDPDGAADLIAFSLAIKIDV